MTSESGETTACGGQCATAGAVSVIVPVWRDASALADLLAREGGGTEEWVVVDGGPPDEVMTSVRERHRAIRWLTSPRGRGPQLNAGAAVAIGDWLLFVHADSRLPAGWHDEIARAATAGATWGCFRFALDSPAWQARLIEWGVAQRVRWLALPYGDQGIFVRRDVFTSVGGYPPYPLMEDVALVRRLASRQRPWRSPLTLRTSARRWERDGWIRRSATNVWLLLQYLAGVPPDRLVARYERTRG